MWNNLWNAGVGITLSTFMPEWAKKEDRIESVIEAIAKDRGVPNWFHDFQVKTIKSDGLNISLRILEIDDAKGVFVFMPGTNAYALLYGQFLLAMAKLGFTVIGFDPRGHGCSDGARGSYTIEELLKDYTNVVNYAQSTFDLPIVASGSSQGGIVAFYHALSNPNLAALICHNIADLSDNSSVVLTRFGALGNYLKPIVNQFNKLVPELPIPMPFYLNLRREKVKGKRNALQVLLEDPLIPWYVRLKTMKSLGFTPPPNPRETLSVPTLILQAEHDTIFPTDYVVNILSPCPNVEIQIIENAYHYMIVDEVDKVTSVVEKWLFKSKLLRK